ncbi:MAG: DUF4179 domain-containing protein [Deltaproteobacteria bacterium]
MDIESMLKSKKMELDRIEVPIELETRLRSALDRRSSHLGARIDWRAVAFGLILVILIGYNYDAVAYYGRKLAGYEQVMNGTLRQLNEMGKGQIINKSCNMPSGVVVTLDGIMLDANQLIVFCSLRNPQGKLNDIDLSAGSFISGSFGKYLMKSGQGILVDQGKKIRWTFKCEPPMFLERKLTYNFTVLEMGHVENGSITFRLNRDKAMGCTLNAKVDKTIELGTDKITIESVAASPTSTVINGSMQNIMELGIDQILGERMRPQDLTMQLIANDKNVTQTGGNISTDIHGINFRSEYDALPSDLKKLQIKIVNFGADHDVNQQIPLNENKEDVPVNVLNQSITINRVFESDGDIFVTLSSEESVILSRVYAVMDKRRIELLETVDEKIEKGTDGKITRTRTLHFKGTGNKLVLDIQRMSYRTDCNKTIDIPVH